MGEWRHSRQRQLAFRMTLPKRYYKPICSLRLRPREALMGDEDPFPHNRKNRLTAGKLKKMAKKKSKKAASKKKTKKRR
jgi:hypothetical protein